MRIVVDMQGAQSTGSRDRGIGRYTMSFVQALVRNRGQHEIILALNGMFEETIEPIRAAFSGSLPQSQIAVWKAATPVAGCDSDNDWRRLSAERVREAFLGALQPDLVVVSSLIEGLDDDAVTSIGSFATLPTATVLYDLIPYMYRRPYLDDPNLERWYLSKIDHLRRSDLWLAISESSRQEGIDYLNLEGQRVINVSTAADPQFRRTDVPRELEETLRRRYGLSRSFVMYGGGIDHRKNIEGLIRAFARLRPEIRDQYQLAIVCAAYREDKDRLCDLATQEGLAKGDVVLTGFVPDDDLVLLYNLCSLFVFPSWHEGFGLPVLEAMCCGAPVIGANRSSIPEVIGWEEALFDPHSDAAIAAAIDRALDDEDFLSQLSRNAQVQAQKFSWDRTAREALAAFEEFKAERDASSGCPVDPAVRPRLAYVSPLPPARSGVADYSAGLLPELARHYRIDLIVDQKDVSDRQARASWPVRSIEWFVQHESEFDRVVYHFGNSTFHKHMFELLESIPGVVVLHDFFLSGVISYLEMCMEIPDAWVKSLYHSHGYRALKRGLRSEDREEVTWEFPCNLDVLQKARGIITHSVYSAELAQKWYGNTKYCDWSIIPHMRKPDLNPRSEGGKAALGFSDEDFLICSFGVIGPAKLNDRLLDAWLQSDLRNDPHCHLIFVGASCDRDYDEKLAGRIKTSDAEDRVLFTGWAEPEIFQKYLAAADVGVQLRSRSRGETSGAALDCMKSGIATIVNANGSMNELPTDAVIKLSDEFDQEELVQALEDLCRNSERRKEIGQAAKEYILHNHNPRHCGDRYASAIDEFYRKSLFGPESLLSSIASIEGEFHHSDLVALAHAIDQTFPPHPCPRQLFIDVSELIQRDAGTGIQRVVRNLVKELLESPPKNARVEPVYATVDHGYLYARGFTTELLGCATTWMVDEPISAAAGDIFLGLDLQPDVVVAQREFYQRLRQQGVEVRFVVYDLLCMVMPQHFRESVRRSYERWLSVIMENDGAICISRAVAGELQEWFERQGPNRHRPFEITWVHLGADIDNVRTGQGMPTDSEGVLATLSNRLTFSVVGTLEPRKAHTQVLLAFESLWDSGVDANLVFVGKQGWLVDGLVESIRSHSMLGKRLFWLDGIGDEYLERIYDASECLISASEGEGFGLPLIEAAQHEVPIIARDIPVFREIAGDNAYYFSGSDPTDLAKAVTKWIDLYERDRHPSSASIPWNTWRDSTKQLKNVLFDDKEHGQSESAAPKFRSGTCAYCK